MSCVLTQRSRKLMLGALAIGVSATAVVYASKTAIRAVLGPSVRITIAHELKLPSHPVAFAENKQRTLKRPRIVELAITTHRERFRSLEQSFIISENLSDAISGLTKQTPSYENDVERSVHQTLRRRFQEVVRTGLPKPVAPEGIQLDVKPEYSEHGVEPDQAGLMTLIASHMNKDHRRIVIATNKVSTQAKDLNTQTVGPKARTKASKRIANTEAATIKVKQRYQSRAVEAQVTPQKLLAVNEAAPSISRINEVKFQPVLLTRESATTTDATDSVKIEPALSLSDNEPREDVDYVGGHYTAMSNQAEPQSLDTQNDVAAPLSLKQVSTHPVAEALDTQAPVGPTGPIRVITLPLKATAPVNENTSSQPSPPTNNNGGDSGASTPSKPDSSPRQPTTGTSPETQGFATQSFTDENAGGTDQRILYKGKVLEAFSGAQRSVSNATVQILGTEWKTTTDADGAFSFDGLSVDGVLPIVVTKTGYLKRRVDLKQNVPAEIELVSENSANLAALAVGEKTVNGTAMVFGQLVSPNKETVAGLKVELVGSGTALPTYLDSAGIPKKELIMTSARGQFVFMNVLPGTYLLVITDALEQERAPHVVHIGQNEGLVRKFSTGEKRFIRGAVFNASALNAKVNDAKIRLLGSKLATTTNADGTFTLGPVYIDCHDMNYLQIEKSGFYRNRVDYACEPEQVVKRLFTFSASYTDAVAADARVSLESNHGAVIGHVGYTQSVKMQLWGPEELDASAPMRGVDYYFETDGLINPDLNRTTKNGNFSILQAPEGLSYIQAFSADNRTLSYWPILISPSTVNVYVQ